MRGATIAGQPCSFIIRFAYDKCVVRAAAAAISTVAANPATEQAAVQLSRRQTG